MAMDDLPQPKRGTPGWGALTLMGFGDAGVTGAEESILVDVEVGGLGDLESLSWSVLCCNGAVLPDGKGQGATECCRVGF